MKRLILVLLFAMTLRAEDAASVLARSDAYRNPLDSFAIDVELTSYEGKETERSSFRVHGKGSDRSVVEFLAPVAEKGKFLLMLRDAMWIYMPSASRPIRISPLQRLMGQASNGDVARTNFTTDYTAAAMKEEGDVWVLDLVARDPSIAYKRVQLRVDRKTHEPRSADFYVASGKLLKRAHYREYAVMNGRRVVSFVEIEDLVRPGRRTTMRYTNLVAKQHPDSMFTREALARW